MPNLDYKILQGNSLFDDFGGDIESNGKNVQMSFDNSVSDKDRLIELYFKKIKEFDLLTDQITKKTERNEINEILKKIILNQIESIKSFDKNNPYLIQLSKNLEDLDKKINDFFCWNIIFHKIFKLNGGFDIMLANPPYVRQEKIIHFKDRLKRKYNLFNSTSDLYVYFYELSFNLLKEKGTSVFITSNKWMRAKYGKLLRIFFKNEVCLSEIMNFSEMKVFENAITNTNITVFSKNKSKNESINYTEFSKDQSSDDLNKFYNKNSIPIIKNKLDLENFYFLDKKNENLKYKIENKCEPLVNFNYKIYKGIYTGFNEAFIINDKTKNDIINKSNKTLKFIKPILRGRI